MYIGEETDIVQSIQSKLCIGKIDQVSDEITRVLEFEQRKLELEIARCHRILDCGTDNILQISAGKCSVMIYFHLHTHVVILSFRVYHALHFFLNLTGNTPRSARSTASENSEGTPRSKKRCLSCGDRLLTSESTIKVPGAVRIKISDPNIAFCSSCQLVYHLDSMEGEAGTLMQSKSQSSIKRIDCVKGFAPSHRAYDDEAIFRTEGKAVSKIPPSSTPLQNEEKLRQGMPTFIGERNNRVETHSKTRYTEEKAAELMDKDLLFKSFGEIIGKVKYLARCIA